MEAVLDSGVIGRGLVAQSLRRLVNHHPQAIFFASGTGDSTCRDQMIFSRERELLEAAIGDCRRAGLRLVYCSSAGAVYGCFPGMRDEETECLPVTPYGIHKLGCEALVRTSDVHHLILRISNLVGPSANACQLLPSLVRQILSRLVPEKSPLELLDAFAAVRERVQTAHLVIVGSGQLERQTRRKTARFGAAVTFAGEAYGDTLKGWYARADMLLNPSATEAFSTVNLEAMASGTPVIAAASGGNLDQIIPERNGLFSRPHDPADLAAQIIALLTDPPRLAKMSSLCRESVLPLDWNACCERLEHEMLRLVANRRPAVGQLGVNSTRPAKAAA